MAKYNIEVLKPAVENNISFAGVLRSLGIKQSGGMQCHIKSAVIKLGISTEHFLGKAANCGSNHIGGCVRKTASQILVLRDENSYYEKTINLRRALLEIGREHSCEVCGCKSEWNGKALVLEIDHKNGVKFDNREDNLRFICPNCHSQTDNYGNKKRA